MSVYSPPPVEPVRASLTLDDRVVDLAARALVAAVVPSPRWARESEVVSGVRAAADAGADLVEVPADPKLLGPAAQAAEVPVAARVTTPAAAATATAAGAALLLVPGENLETVLAGERTVAPVAVLARDPRAVRAVRSVPARGPDERPVALDTIHLTGVDLVAETTLGLSVGARIVRTGDVRKVRRVVEVMAALLEARR